MQVLIADTETNGLLDRPDLRLHMLQLGSADGDDVTIYGDFDPALGIEAGLKNPVLPLAEGLGRLAAADKVVFHNGIGFDFDALQRTHPGFLRREQILDTLVMARLAYPQERRHDLRSWGDRLGVPKDAYSGDYQTVTPDFLTYSEQDIQAGRALFHKVKHVLEWGNPEFARWSADKERLLRDRPGGFRGDRAADAWDMEMQAVEAKLAEARLVPGTACDLEHEVQWALIAQERNGFWFDVKAAQELTVRLRAEQAEVERKLQETFPPLKRQRWIVPKRDNRAKGWKAGVRTVAAEWDEPFNPGSRPHIAERLQMAGWKPSAYGASGVPTVDEETLSNLPFPEAKLLVQYLRLGKTLGAVSDGDGSYLKLVKDDSRIHGRVNGNGARTGRMAHSKPNTANVDKDPVVRGLFKARPGWKLVGCDGEGIQLRILSHYLHRYDGGALADRIVNGKKEDGTDPHSVNAKAVKHLGEVGRDGAKTLIYAKLFGSTDGGLAHSLKEACRAAGKPVVKMNHYALGKEVNKALATGMTGLDRLEASAQAALKARGYLVGLDGRRIFSDHPRLALVSLCQGGEAVVMKRALGLFMEAQGALHGETFGLCANIHDEVQFEVRPDLADSYGAAFAACITQAGLDLGVRCHMAGAYVVGDNWAETH